MSVVVDIVIVLVLLGCLLQGLRRGFIGSAGSIAGLVAGGVAAALVAPPLGALVPDGTARIVLTLVVAVVLLLAGVSIGVRIGSLIGRPVRRSPLGPLDRVLGAGLQLVAGALAVSVIASLAVTLGTPEVAEAITGSALTERIAALTPAPLAEAMHGVEAGIVAAGAQVGGGALLPSLKMR